MGCDQEAKGAPEWTAVQLYDPQLLAVQPRSHERASAEGIEIWLDAWFCSLLGR